MLKRGSSGVFVGVTVAVAVMVALAVGLGAAWQCTAKKYVPAVGPSTTT